jgi:predicted nucleotidyltransferase component of viral defense system
MLGFDQVEFLVKGVKFSFFVSDNYSPVTSPIEYLGNIRIADIEAIMAMKMEVMLRRMKFRDYYDIYCILRKGYSIHKGIEKELSYDKVFCVVAFCVLFFHKFGTNIFCCRVR